MLKAGLLCGTSDVCCSRRSLDGMKKEEGNLRASHITSHCEVQHSTCAILYPCTPSTPQASCPLLLSPQGAHSARCKCQRAHGNFCKSSVFDGVRGANVATNLYMLTILDALNSAKNTVIATEKPHDSIVLSVMCMSRRSMPYSVSAALSAISG